MSVNVVLMRLRKKGLPMVPIEDPMETEEETPKKELGAADAALAGSIDRMKLERAIQAFLRVTDRFLCCTMWRVTSTMRLPIWSGVRSATASHNYIKRE